MATTRMQLRYLAHARSGDKGDTANVGLIALAPALYPVLVDQVTARRVAKHFKGMVSDVERFELPNLNALIIIKAGVVYADDIAKVTAQAFDDMGGEGNFGQQV